MSDTTNTANGTVRAARMALIAGLILIAFFTTYRLAVARGGSSASPAPAPAATQGAVGIDPLAVADPSGDAAAACACCGPTGTGETIEGAATLDADGVQRIAVDTSNGYDPNIIRLAAGVPAEITFAEAQGCLGQVMSKDLAFFEDLTTGAKTVSLPPLEAGEYGFSCGMEMVFGTVVVE